MSSRCPHDDRDVIEDSISGMVCTACGTVIDTMMFESNMQTARMQSIHEDVDNHHYHHPAMPQAMSALQRRAEACERDPSSGLTPARLSASKRCVESVCRALMLPDSIASTAREIHVELARLNPGFRGKGFEVAAASATYFACLIHGVARGEVEFAANIPGIQRGQLTATNKLARRILRGTKFGDHVKRTIDPSSLVPRVIGVLQSMPPVMESGLEIQQVRREVERILGNSSVKCLAQGRTPECMCASAICVAIEKVKNKKSDRKEIAHRCGISLASLNGIARSMAAFV